MNGKQGIVLHWKLCVFSHLFRLFSLKIPFKSFQLAVPDRPLPEELRSYWGIRLPNTGKAGFPGHVPSV